MLDEQAIAPAGSGDQSFLALIQQLFDVR